MVASMIVSVNIALVKWVSHSGYEEVNEAVYVYLVSSVCDHVYELERVATYSTDNSTAPASVVLVRDSKQVVSICPRRLLSHLLITRRLI